MTHLVFNIVRMRNANILNYYCYLLFFTYYCDCGNTQNPVIAVYHTTIVMHHVNNKAQG
jgi:hypothetical protein